MAHRPLQARFVALMSVLTGISALRAAFQDALLFDVGRCVLSIIPENALV